MKSWTKSQIVTSLVLVFFQTLPNVRRKLGSQEVCHDFRV